MSTAFCFQASPELALQVRLERVRRRWRQADLADKASVKATDVSALELGKRVFTDRAQRVLAVLGLEQAGHEG